MLLRALEESEELLILRILNKKMVFTQDLQQQLSNLEKGYEGELKFESLAKKLEGENLILNSLLLESNGSLFQIDSLIIYQKKLYLNDVKNYEGEYAYDEDGNLNKLPNYPIKDPVLQLKRCDTLLRQLLQKYGFNFPVEAKIIFVNPQLTLFQQTINPQIILPTQVNGFLKKINCPSSELNNRHKKLAELLISLHITKNPNEQIPEYEYDSLKKFVMCGGCNSSSIIVGRTKLTCEDCGSVESVESTVIRSVRELRLLFPSIKITTYCVFEWCGGIFSKKLIRRVLRRNFTINEKYRYSHYM